MCFNGAGIWGGGTIMLYRFLSCGHGRCPSVGSMLAAVYVYFGPTFSQRCVDASYLLGMCINVYGYTRVT